MDHKRTQNFSNLSYFYTINYTIDFNEWIKEKKLKNKELYWKYDGHFNIKVNKEYSKFLINKTNL
tara:strand:- start:127 stop:321 length:195 start_codon:yes stop_codon:yes gene_type:complete